MDRTNAEPGGGMTGATGDLTPAAIQDDFEPGELREIASPTEQASVTHAQAEHRSEHADTPSGEDRDARMGGDEDAPEEERF